jgi:transcriptional regulator GlxA family with amidase domain
MEAPVGIDGIGQPDLLVVPGGITAVELARQPKVLKGLRVTTHWYAHAKLAESGAIPTPDRVVRDGKVITAAGVSAGIDMSLTLAGLIAGEHFAQAVQLDMEYDPEPPFNSGSPATASPEVEGWLRAMYGGMLTNP